MSNKQIGNTYVQVQFQRPYIHKFWANKFRQHIDWQNIYHFINYTLVDTRIKQFRYKLIHTIVATNETLFTWKINNSPYCNCCNELETIEHCFINCTYLDDVWLRVTNTFKSCGISKQVRSLQYLVVGYKNRTHRI